MISSRAGRAMVVAHAVFPVLVFPMLLAAAGCGSVSPLRHDAGAAGMAGRDGGAGGAAGATPDAGKTGSVTLRLVLPSGQSFCDRCGGITHITILGGVGQTLETGVPSCSTTCSSCAPTLCPAVACLPRALPTTNDFTWDGTSNTGSTCGAHVTCFQPGAAPAGRYVARMCATPGVATPADGGFVSTCTPSGPIQCIDVAFDFPGPSPVVGTLP
jgi:hypothetical protein